MFGRWFGPLGTGTDGGCGAGALVVEGAAAAAVEGGGGGGGGGPASCAPIELSCEDDADEDGFTSPLKERKYTYAWFTSNHRLKLYQ